jgi:hypothetical protein
MFMIAGPVLGGRSKGFSTELIQPSVGVSKLIDPIEGLKEGRD